MSQRTVINNGEHTLETLNVLSNDIKAEKSLESILNKASQIIEQSVDPVGGIPEEPSDGLLYGLIQSGKTSIITVAAGMAADNTFQCIVILTSDIDLLYDQTLERVRKAMRGLNVLGKNDWRDATRFERQLRTPPFVIVCSKNGSKLNSLLEAFKSAGAQELSTLIIDDEADQASLNTFTSKGAGQVSRINEVITNFRNFFPVNTYLQVTATPQALFLQRPDHRYRPCFTVLSEPGPGYVGGEAFFGSDGKILRYVDLAEVQMLQATHQPQPTGTIPEGLRRALFVFLVGATSKIIQNPRGGDTGYAFLCHVSVNTRDHHHIVGLMDHFKEDVMNAFQDTSSKQYASIVAELKEAYKDLERTQPDMPEFEKIVRKVKFYFHGANIKLVNAVSKEEIKLDSVYNIFVGGNKLGRGVTIKNLLVSYYGRNPKRPNSDTVLQHARMYGYRQNDLGVTRLYLPERLAEHFRLIHQMESALRDLVQKHPNGKFEGLYISSPLKATRANVLDPNAIGLYVAGGSYNPSYPLRSNEMAKNTAWLDAKLSVFDDASSARQVPIDFLVELIEKCPADFQHGVEVWNLKTLRAALEKLKSLRRPWGDGYLVVRRGRNLQTVRRETQGILDSGEDKLADKDAPSLFIYRQNEIPARGEIAVWWPQLRFPEGNYVLAFSFNR